MTDDVKMLVKTLYDHVGYVLDAIYILYRPTKDINDAPRVHSIMLTNYYISLYQYKTHRIEIFFFV